MRNTTGPNMKTNGWMWLLAALMLLLAGCGDSLDEETDEDDDTASSAIASVTLIADPTSIGTSPAAKSTITAIVKDASNRAVAGEVVEFSASSGVLTVEQATTDESGKAIATLSPGADATNRTVTVSASVGDKSNSEIVSMGGSTVHLTGTSNVALGVATELTVTVRDSSGAAVSGAEVSLSSDQSNVLEPVTLTTDTNGQGSVQFTPQEGGTHDIKAEALNASGDHSVEVASDVFTLSMPPEIVIDNCAAITVNWSKDGVSVDDTVTFAATRGDLYTDSGCTTAGDQLTTSGGSGTLYIQSPNTGPVTVTANGSGVSTEAYAEFIATTPDSLVLQASRTTLGLEDSVTLTATVRDVNKNLVKGVTVAFEIERDKTGGSISPAYSVTDSLGRATTVYSSTGQPSELDGVEIRATVQGEPAISDTVSLTVGQMSLNISIGLATESEELNSSTYHYQGSVQVADSAGNPVAGKEVTLSLDPESYDKGSRQVVEDTDTWVAFSSVTLDSEGDGFFTSSVFAQLGRLSCLNEDLNRDGILDTGEDIEDINGNGDLEPGTPATIDKTVTTDENGNATFYLTYLKDYANWLQVRIRASLEVSGTESSNSLSVLLPALVEDVKGGQKPPGLHSPFGTVGDCSNPN